MRWTTPRPRAPSALPSTGAGASWPRLQKGLVGEIVNISKERDLEEQLKVNIRELEKSNRVIADAAKRDTLTGVYNRRFLDEQTRRFSAEPWTAWSPSAS